MPNMDQIIKNHNRKTIQNYRTKVSQKPNDPSKETVKNRMCNCRDRSNCPLKGNCLAKNIIYKASVSQPETNKASAYIGLTQGSFKTRFNQHTSSFRLEHRASSTSLSEHIWTLKRQNIKHNINWEIIKQVPQTNQHTHCTLCLEEKFCIIKESKNKHSSQLNRRTEINQICPHENRAKKTGCRSTQQQQTSFPADEDG